MADDVRSANALRMAERLPAMSPTETERLRENCLRVITGLMKGDADDANFLLAKMEQRQFEARAGEYELIGKLSLKERVYRSFTKNPMSETEHMLVQVLLENPGSFSAKLSALCDYKGQSWHLHFGMMCGRREGDLAPVPPSTSHKRIDGTASDFWSGILADYDEAQGWTMKPDAVQGFAELGLKAGSR